MSDKEDELEKAKRELQEYYKSPIEKKKLANKIKEINENFDEKLIGETAVWIESSLDKIGEDKPQFLKEPHIFGTKSKADKYVRSQNKPSKEERTQHKKTNERIKRNSFSTLKLGIVEVIEILRFDNNNVLWNKDLIDWRERDWKELIQIKEKYMPTISKTIKELENNNSIEKNVIYNKFNENYEF